MANIFEISETAKALHYSSFVADLHADTLLWDALLGYDMLARHHQGIPYSPLFNHIDVPRMIEGGTSLQAFAVVPNYWFRKKKSAEKKARRLQEIIERSDTLEWALSGTEAESVWKNGKIGTFLGMEGIHPLEGKIENLQGFYDKGVRYASLTHFNKTEAGYPSIGKKNRKRGLTGFGKELISAMNDMGMMLDLAHLGYQCFLDAIEVSKAPVIVSHTGVKADSGHARALDKAQMKAVAEKNGVTGIIFSPMFLGKMFGDARMIVDAIDLVKDIAGIDHVALGSDFDGFLHLCKGIRDARDLPVITQLMLNRGYTDEEVKKVLGLNFLRVYKEVCK